MLRAANGFGSIRGAPKSPYTQTDLDQPKPIPPRVSIALSTLHLPPSLQTPSHISPKLWCWLQGPDNRIPFTSDLIVTPLDRARDAAVLRRAVAETKIIITDHFLDDDDEVKTRMRVVGVPEHLRDLANTVMAGGVGTVGNGVAPAAEGYGANLEELKIPRPSTRARRPVSAATFSTEKIIDTPLARAQTMKKPAFAPVKSNPIPRFFLQLAELRFNSCPNMKSVQCTISVGTTTVTSNEIELTHATKKNQPSIAQPREGFLFDVPFTTNDIPIAIQIHSPSLAPQNHNEIPSHARRLSASSQTPSTASNASAFSVGVKTLRGQFARLGAGMKRAPWKRESTEGGVMEVKWMQMGMEEGAAVRRQMKATMECKIMCGGREVGTMMVQTGFVVDEEYPPKPEVPLVEHEDYLNFQVNSRMGAYFKRYWVIVRGGVLEAYDFEYKETKPRIATLPLLSHLHICRLSNPEVNCAPNCLELRFRTPKEELVSCVDGERDQVGDGGVVPEHVEKWRMSLIDLDDDGEGELVYVTAESKEAMSGWMDIIGKYAGGRC